MPCYDKKLEASREDFYNDIYRTRDVDCVISTSKFVLLLLTVCSRKIISYFLNKIITSLLLSVVG